MDFDITGHIIIHAEQCPDVNVYIKYLLTLIYHDDAIVYTKNVNNWEGFDVRDPELFTKDMSTRKPGKHTCIIIDFSPEKIMKTYELIYERGHTMGVRLINIVDKGPHVTKNSPYSLFMYPKDKNIVAVNSRRGSHHTLNVPN